MLILVVLVCKRGRKGEENLTSTTGSCRGAGLEVGCGESQKAGVELEDADADQPAFAKERRGSTKAC